nr:hypothetical protein [Candidatus Sigynarchaeota archaeon]
MKIKDATRGNKSLVIMLLVMLAVPAILVPVLQINAKRVPAVDKLVMADLYTWYGTPDGPFGEYLYRNFDKHGAIGDWNLTGTTMATPQVSVNAQRKSFNATATCTGQANNVLVLNSTLAAFSTYDRKYFKINVSISNINLQQAIFSIRLQNKLYTTNITLDQGFTVIRKVFPAEFSKANQTGANFMAITMIANSTGYGQAYSLLVESVIISTWAHYNEDNLAYYNTTVGQWFNYPPFTKATDKNVYFPGNISDALGPIPAYGNYTHLFYEKNGPNLDQVVAPASYLGIYDSLDPVVIEAQLRLMFKAGIDVVMLMHPGDFNIAETIMNVAWDVRQRFEALGNDTFDLKFIYYNGWNIMIDLLAQIENYAHYDDLYLKVNGGPAFYVGYTGLLEEPFATYASAFNAIRAAHPSVFMIGDGYLPPKEEMLGLLDGFYFYDTSGLMRMGYGLPEITVYQPDGSPSHGYGRLDEIFVASSSMIHAHGGVYAATVIPGTDNTCVHDFTGSPLYDGRPGTIVERTGGLTFNYTWQCSMAAGAEWITITSWNELHEGTEIEPTVENGTFYVQLCSTWSAEFKNV